MWYGHVMRMEDCKIARQVVEWHPKGKGRASDQSIHRRMGLGTTCKEETSRMKNVSIVSSGGGKSCLWVEEKQKNSCIYISSSYHPLFLDKARYVYIRIFMLYTFIWDHPSTLIN
jgi:hypothetical protein